jgi:soluble cytochrome b562
MASRTSTGMAMGITVTIFIVLSVTLFVLTMVFYSQAQDARRDLRLVEDQQDEIIAPSERGAASVQGYLDRANQERESLVGYLISELRDTMTTASGNADLTHAQLIERLGGEGAGSMVARLDRLTSQLTNETRARTDAEAARDRAAEDLRAEAQRIQVLENELRQGQARTDADIQNFAGGVQDYQQKIDDFLARVQDEVDQLKREQSDEVGEYQDDIAQLEQDILVLRDRLQRASGVARPEVFRPTDEFALVDAEIVAVQPADNAVTLSIGARQKVSIGMTFAVYAEPSQIRPDDAGNYPQGKAVLEVIRVDDTTSTARVIRATQGNPSVVGDVVANPLYDPDRVYKFLVYGNFDTDRDGRATRFEADRLASLIRQWGGQTVNEITGDLDFLVLGRQPVLPPQPGPGAPLEAVQEYVRLQNIVNRYEQLFQRAERTNIPVLNENRLYTLIGAFPR